MINIVEKETAGKGIKVLHINETHRETGGQERYFFGLVNGLRKRGFDVYSFGFDTVAKKTDKSLVMKTPGYFIKQFNRFVFDFGTYFKRPSFGGRRGCFGGWLSERDYNESFRE